MGADVRRQLTRLAERVAVPAQRGMTRKNRDRLRVLQDDRALRRLLDLPERRSEAVPDAASTADPVPASKLRKDGSSFAAPSYPSILRG